MVITIISWIIIALYFFVIGIAVSCLIDRFFNYQIKEISSIIVIGIVFSTIYAETFSLFYKVSAIAFILLSVFVICTFIFGKKKIIDAMQDIKSYFLIEEKKKSYILSIIYIFTIIFISYLSSRAPSGYDAENYHIPSIRWLEEYGAVKGLGNLHSRLAYNSSFHSLQALFSFSWILKQSLHSMNGFLWMFMAFYALKGLFFSNVQRKNLSDFLRILTLIALHCYLILDLIEPISAPITDFFSAFVIFYIFIEWCSLNEKKEKRLQPYLLLGVLGLFSVSLKLSAFVVALFYFFAIALLIKKHKFNELIKWIVLGMIVIVPFLARNIIISGYLVYPVSELDIFNFDWEMPKSVIISDNIMIKVYARACGIDYKYEDIKKNTFEWMQIWLKRIDVRYFILVIFDLLMLPVAVVIELMEIRKNKTQYDTIILNNVLLGFVFWLFSAPSVRFGFVWVILFPMITVYMLCKRRKKQIRNLERRVIEKRGYLLIALCWMICLLISIKKLGVGDIYKVIISPIAYSEAGSYGKSYIISGKPFYYCYPDNKLNGYYGFPGTEHIEMLEKIELRGDSLKDGFSVNSICRNQAFDFRGYSIDKSLYKSMNLEKYY